MSVEQKVKQIIVEQLGVDEGQVDSTASFVDDLGADSLDIVELVMAFEEARFGLAFAVEHVDAARRDLALRCRPALLHQRLEPGATLGIAATGSS